MHQRTGSVYLDAPTRPSRVPTKTRRRSRSGIAGICVGVGLTALTIAVLTAGVRHLVLDTDPVMTAIEQTLDDPVAVEELRTELAKGIEDGLVGEEVSEVAAAYGLDVAEEADRVSVLVIEDDAVRNELRELAESVHNRVFIDGSTAVVDVGPLSAAIRAVVEQHSPRLALVIPADAELWAIDGDSFPDLSAHADRTLRVQRDALIAALLIPIGLAIHPRRHNVAAWVGRWALGTGLVGAVAAVGLPYLGAAITGQGAAEVAIRALSLKLLAPAAVTGILGMGLASLAAVLRHRENRRVADEGAAAALGYDEPPLWTRPGSPTIDLAGRGLVDVNQPLTNI